MKETLLPFEKRNLTPLVNRDVSSSSKYGQDYTNRPIEELIEYGVVNINKPRGPTSHQISAYVRDILGIEKCGHSGTLDPNVTGVLPIALGRGTRVVQTLLISGKEYVCMMHLHDEIPEGKIINSLKKFVGKIKQLPPIKSAVKRQWRYRKVYYIDIIDIKGKDVLFRVGCQAGTYIRKLCHDIGKDLGCGAHMAELVRTKAGPFDDKEVYTLQELTDALWFYKKEKNENYLRKIIKPIEDAVVHLKKVWVLDSTVDTICHGADLKIPGVAKIDPDIELEDIVAVMTLKGELVAIGIARMSPKDAIKNKRGICIKINKVFMKTGLYPRFSQ